jgi:CHAT domain-containing protein
LAASLQARGRYADATQPTTQALTIYRKVLGENHPATASSYNNLAVNLKVRGKAAEATPLLEKALAINRKVFRENHPTTAQSYGNLAANLEARGKAAEAAPLFEKALAIQRKVLGDSHLTTANGYSNLALNLQTRGKSAEAAPLFEKALAIHRSVFGEDHADTARDYSNLAINLQARGRSTEAAPLFEKALAIRRKVLGEDHPETAGGYSLLAVNLEDLGKAAEAAPLLEKSLAIRRKVLGEDHPDTAVSHGNLAFNLQARGKTDEAASPLEKSLAIHRKVLGEDHPLTANSYCNLALNLHARGKTDEAAETLRQAIYSSEASRLNRAKGVERAIGASVNPRRILAVIEQATNPTDAWAQAEMSLARGLLDEQKQTLLTPAEQADRDRLRDRVADVQLQILALVSNTSRTDAETQELGKLMTDRRELENQLAKLAVAESTRAVADPKAIRAALPVDAALLLWVDGSAKGGIEEHFACVIRRDGDPVWARLPGSGEQGKWTPDDTRIPSGFREALIQKKPEAEISALAKRLHAQRIAPVAKALAGVKTLYVVGVDYMAGIPVEVLAPEYTISYVPSGTSLARLPKKPAFADTLLAVGDPIYETDKPEAVRLTALPPGGLLIQQLTPGGSADKARLLPGDVLLQYADAPLKSIDDLRTATQKAVEQKVKEVAVTVWRVDERDKAGERTVNLPAGPLGVVLARDPAPQAIADRRKMDEVLASFRGGGSWKDLPGTRFEVARIAALFEKPIVLFDGKASETELDTLRTNDRLKGFRYLHFATHGKGNDVLAFDSALILSQDQPGEEFAPSDRPWRDNRVTAREVLDHWKLNADLVTLSACETAIGKQGGGDGLLGFAQAFLTAGSRSVCLSLWEVDDTATALLMHRFYQNLLGKREGLKSPLPKAAALREAKEWLRNLTAGDALRAGAALTNGVVRGGRKEITGKVVGTPPKPTQPGEKPYAHPQYWAAFVLLGDPD